MLQQLLCGVEVVKLPSLQDNFRDVAQFGRALALGASGRRFESYHPDCPVFKLDYLTKNNLTLIILG